MYSSCIRTLLAGEGSLKINICGIERPVLDRDIPDLQERPSAPIPDAFWFVHLEGTKISADSIQKTASELLCTIKLLFWLELPILRGTLKRFTQILEDCSSSFKVSIAIVS